MDFFETGLRLRRVSKRFLYIRKAIDFIPIFSKFDIYVYKYSRVRIEEKKIVSYLLIEGRTQINLVCDLRCTPPTYGDFSAFLMAIRILSSKFDVSFVMVFDELRPDWDLLNREEQLKRFNDFRGLASKVLGDNDVEIKIASSFSELRMMINEGQTIFSDFVLRRKKIYWDLKFLNQHLFRSLGCEPEVLFDHTVFSVLKLKPFFKYVLWHIRTESLWDKEIDNTDREIAEVYKILKKVLPNDVRIIVCGNQEGLKRVADLSVHNKFDLTSARIYSEDFLGDLTLIKDSIFFLQLGGGGLAEFAWSSSVPFFIHSYPWSREEFKMIQRIKKNILGITTWQTPNQVFLLRSRKKLDSFENQLRRFWSELNSVD